MRDWSAEVIFSQTGFFFCGFQVKRWAGELLGVGRSYPTGPTRSEVALLPQAYRPMFFRVGPAVGRAAPQRAGLQLPIGQGIGQIASSQIQASNCITESTMCRSV